MSPTTTQAEDALRADLPTGRSTLAVEYTDHGGARLHLTTDPDDVESSARLLCAAVSHVRRRHTRRVHTALELNAPSSATLLAALQAQVGVDIEDIAMRRAGSTAMVTLELPPAPALAATAHDLPAPRAGTGDRPPGRTARPQARGRRAQAPQPAAR